MLQKIIKQLKERGFRNTKARIALLNILRKIRLPLTEPDIRAHLAKEGIRPNKTTIYRELAKLGEHGFVREVDFGDGKKRFESEDGDHHHHLVCKGCEKVEDFSIENELTRLMQKIGGKNKFKIVDHSLEFFGFCRDCRKAEGAGKMAN
jgi:Fur family ferric uptake transcriptional regulator